MDLQGTLDKMSLPDLLQMLANGEQEGTLVIKQGRDERRLHVNTAGKVLVHVGIAEHSLLGKRLHEAGIILEQEFLNAMRRQSLKVQPLGEILRSYKSVSGEKIDEIIRILVMDKLVELFGWDAGDFQFKEGMEETELPYTEVGFDSGPLIMEAVRQFDELKRTSGFDWAPTHVFVASEQDADVLQDDELARRILSCVDGVRNVEGVSTYCGASLADTVSALWRLSSAGLVRLATPEELYAKAEESRGCRQYLKSRWLLREAVRQDPAPKYLRKLAEYSQEDGDDQEAAGAYVTLARALLESEPQSSVESLETAIAIDEKNADARELLCRLHISTQNLAGALKEAESLERVCFDRPRALACYRLLSENKPGDLSVRLPLARLLAATRNFDEAYEECNKLERVLPPNRQVELLPIYENIARAGRRQEEITTRIRRIRKLAAESHEPLRARPAQRSAAAVLIILVFLFIMYQGVSQFRLSMATRRAKDLELAEKYKEAGELFTHLATTSVGTPIRSAAQKRAEEYGKLAAQQEAAAAFEAAVASAQALVEEGDFSGARARIEAFQAAFPGYKTKEARSVLEKLEDVRAHELVAMARSLRNQALELEKAGLASKAIEIYDRLAGDEDLLPFAGLAGERARALRAELQEARTEVAAAQELERVGNVKEAHVVISGILAKYPATRNDIPVRLPFLIDSKPMSAEVRVEGELVGKTPQVLHYSPESPRRVSVVKPGFSTVTFQLSEPREWAKLVSLSKLPLWTFRAEGALDTAPSLRGGVLFFGSRDTHVYAVSAGSGEQLWKRKTGALSEVTSTPAVTDKVVIVGTVDGGVIAFDPSSGEPRWSFATNGFVRSPPEVDAASERGCVGSADGSIYGFSTSSGNVTWKVDAGSSVSASAARYGKSAIYATEKGRVLALDIVSGSVVWSEETGVNPVGIALADGTAIVASSNGEVLGLDADSGEIIWRKVARGRLSSPPAASRGQALVATHLGEVAVFQARTGTEVQRIELPEEAPAHLASDGDLLVAATTKGAIFAMDMEAEEIVWPATTAGGISSSPLLTEKEVFVTSRDCAIYAYRRDGK